MLVGPFCPMSGGFVVAFAVGSSSGAVSAARFADALVVRGVAMSGGCCCCTVIVIVVLVMCALVVATVEGQYSPSSERDDVFFFRFFVERDLIL